MSIKTNIPSVFSISGFLGFLSLIFLLLGTSCTIEPVPINYGADACSSCSMNIIDKQHAAELVTNKGKAYKFDAIECMVSAIRKRSTDDIAIVLVSDYSNPGELTAAGNATYLISEGIKSPMGAFLTAFSKEADAIQAQKEKGGAIYGWMDLQQQVKLN